MLSSRSLEGKAVLVTGAGGGIGRASSLLLARAGAHVIISDLNTEAGEATAAAVSAIGGTCTFVCADLAQESSVEALIAAAVRAYGRLDGAFNNAGISQVGKPLADLSTAEWERAIRVDLTSVFWCMKYQLKAMTDSGGAIVNTASSLGQVAISNASEYVAAKHGVIGLTRAAAAEYGAHGVRVNSVLPGVIRTPMSAGLTEAPHLTAFHRKLRERHPVQRFGEPSEVGEAVVWLLSDAASFVNGAAIAVDGGYLAI
jgi:NAD(P)-dependent dehydrogenase (short-subunit alcohol dehydrogenase family)